MDQCVRKEQKAGENLHNEELHNFDSPTDQMKWTGMGKTHVMHGREEKCIHGFSGNT